MVLVWRVLDLERALRSRGGEGRRVKDFEFVNLVRFSVTSGTEAVLVEDMVSLKDREGRERM